LSVKGFSEKKLMITTDNDQNNSNENKDLNDGVSRKTVMQDELDIKERKKVHTAEA